PVHPDLVKAFPSFKAGLTSSIAAAHDGDALADGLESFTFSGKAVSPPLPGLPPDQHRKMFGFVGRPNFLCDLLHDYVMLETLQPLAPDQTRVVCDWLFDPEAMEQQAFDPTDAVEMFDMVNRQDWDVCELLQRGVSSRSFKSGGVFLPHES